MDTGELVGRIGSLARNLRSATAQMLYAVEGPKGCAYFGLLAEMHVRFHSSRICDMSGDSEKCE